MESIKEIIDESFIKNIFSNQEEKKDYLQQLYQKKGIDKKIPREKGMIEQDIIDTWDYEISKEVLRDMFRKTQKYRVAQNANQELKRMEQEWEMLNLGTIEWPYAAMTYDAYVQRINHNTKMPEQEKDQIIQKAAVKYRRIKEINTNRNDYIECLIFEHNENIIPTLKHRTGIDFYIDGVAYDQKVSRSVGKAFKESHEDEYREYAIAHPEEVAKGLYIGQDEERFGAEPRLLIVYLDEDVTVENIEKIIHTTKLDQPMDLQFDYPHKKTGIRSYETKCFVILLYNLK